MSESLYLAKNSSSTIPIGGAVIFDTVMFDTGGISYSPLTGVVTFNQKGVYRINWWVASQTVGSSAAPVITLVATGGGNYTGDSPLQQGVITGMGIFNVTSAPATLTLYNLSSGDLSLTSSIPVKAMIGINLETAAGTVDTMQDFQYRQLAHVLAQIITLYPGAAMRTYTPGLYEIDGAPTSLYTSPEATNPGVFVMTLAPDLESVPLNTIMAFRTGEGTDYNESITYLAPPSPLPVGWDANIITAVHDYLSVGDAVDIYWGIGNNTSGFVYKNEYGMFVVTADMTGAEPYFILPMSTLIILTPVAAEAAGGEEAGKDIEESGTEASAISKKGIVRIRLSQNKTQGK